MSITNVPYFKPTSIAACSLWLDGADPAGNGIVPAAGNLATWVDKSSAANNATAGTSVYPQYNTGFLNNLGVVGLTNAADYFTVANNLNSASLTYILLVKPTAANTGSKCGFLSTDTPSLYGRSIALNNMVFEIEYYNGFALTSVTTNSSTWYIVSVVFNGTSSITLSYNGIISTYAGSGTGTNSAGLVIGSYNSASSYTTYNANFYLAEAIVYSSALSQTQYQQVEAYLAQKWGLTGSLPTGHPGYTTLQYRSPTFSPTQLPGCTVWLDAADSNTFTGSSPVTAWRDKANGYSFAGTATTASAIGGTTIGCLSFNSSSQYLTFSNSSTIITPPYTVYTVGYQLNNALGRLVNGIRPGSTDVVLYVGGWSGSVGTAFVGDGTNWNPYPDTAGSTRFGNTVNTWALTCCTVSNTASTSVLNSYFNGATQAVQTGSVLAATLSGMNIGGGIAGAGVGGQAWYGYIGEVIFYNSVLSVSQRQQVEAYLAKKWGLASSLSTDHLGATSVAFKNSSSLLAPVPFTSLPYAFAPTQITGCSLWLDGADPAGNGVTPANNASITTWADKSGLGNTATNQGSAGSVTFTAAGLVFNGSGYFYMPGLAGNLVNTAFVIFMVETLNTTGGTMLIGDDAQTNYNTNNVLHIMYRTSTNHTFAFWDNDLEDYAVSGTGNRRIWTFWLPTASNRVTRRNGAVDVTHGNYSRLNYWSTPAIGRGFGGNTYVGTMSEVIIYPSDIGISNIQKVEAYLGQKWGLKSSLGAGHVGLTTDYFNSQSILRRAALTTPIRLSLTTGSATGGTITTANGYRTHSFTTVGSTNFVVTGALKLQVLIVGGGGGGGFTNCAGGGGAGGAVATILVISAGTFSVTVGGGGTGGNYTASVLTQATNGSSSSFNGITGIGGGYGGTITSPINGALGGCGGGGSYNGGLGAGGTQGGSGANGSGFGTPPNSGAGGGGMGGNGGAPNLVGGNSGGAGGLGVTYVIGGTSYTVSGGGAGGSDGNQGSGGSGIGGNGGTPGTPLGAAGNGTQNTGSGGGGGGGGFADTTGGNGGSGIVVIAYVYP